MKKLFALLIWLCFFISGSLLSLFYVQGWRFEFATGEVMKTGVLSISTIPEEATLIFLDDKFVGKSPQVFRGFPLGKVHVRLEASNSIPLETDLVVREDFVTELAHIHLLPKNPRTFITPIGSAEEVVWDSEKRGYVRLFHDLSIIDVVNFVTSEKSIIELTAPPRSITLTKEGKLMATLENGAIEAQDVFSQGIFSSEKVRNIENFFSLQRQKLLSFEKNELFLKDVKTKKITKAFALSEQILEASWLSKSDDILIVTPSQILFWNDVMKTSRVFLSGLSITETFFLSDQKQLIYKENNIWNSIIFEKN
ncbi:hypothetical protein HZA38_00825 [Candidatus Peregrinibacteria bacterium]|nr:hypothetical protein [Candidatus Peregrinibacteria bacterium]